MTDKIKGMLGLANRAGRLIKGEQMVLDAIRSGKARIVLVAEDASDNTKKLFSDKCSYYGVAEYVYGSKSDFGHASMAICDRNFSDAVRKLLK